jgi:DnaJ-domain-containing protein 1
MPIEFRMEAMNYYVTTLTNAFKTLAPYFIFLVGGYFIFVKLPFLFLKKSMSDQKKKLQEESSEVQVTEKYTVDDYNAFKERLKLMNGEGKTQTKSESKTHQHEQQKQQKQKQKEERKAPPKRPAASSGLSPEEVLGLKVNEPFTMGELKKRYFELLKQNHPDRVNSMGPDFKKLAEKNTKQINEAYEKLKKKAS